MIIIFDKDVYSILNEELLKRFYTPKSHDIMEKASFLFFCQE